jgi:hypothetical protein
MVFGLPFLPLVHPLPLPVNSMKGTDAEAASARGFLVRRGLWPLGQISVSAMTPGRWGDQLFRFRSVVAKGRSNSSRDLNSSLNRFGNGRARASRQARKAAGACPCCACSQASAQQGSASRGFRRRARR